MKILVNTGRFNGGAPLSILEYAKIAKKEGYEVIAVGEHLTNQDRYSKSGIKTYNIPYFSWKRIKKNFYGLIALSKIIKREKPDILHATSYGIIPSKFMGKFYGIPVLYSIAGGKTTGSAFDDEKVIVYSEENKEDLVYNGYSKEKIDVISNRMHISTNSNNNPYIYESPHKEIRLLLISRLDVGVIRSVKKLIDTVSLISEELPNIQLDIIGDGELYSTIADKAKKINLEQKKNIIILHGYVNNTSDYINNAHIVFGKGRSIIEAILHNRISFVISEDNSLSFCKPETIPNLYKYNFSGRKIILKSSIDELTYTIKGIIEGNICVKQVEKTTEMVDQLYNIKHAESKIVQYYEDKSNLIEIKPKKIEAVYFLLKVYINEVFNVKKWVKRLENYRV